MTTTAQFQRLLCPTDFSPFSVQALRHAVALARVFGSRLKVVHVIPQLFPGGESLYASAPWLTTPEVRQRVDEEMRVFLEPLRVARINHEIEIREGDPWREIVAAADEMPADLVLGTHGRGGLDRLFLGSVAEKLVRRLPCPVFSVSHEEGRTWAAPGLITRIVCATDFSPIATEALHMAIGLAEKFRAELTTLKAARSIVFAGPSPKPHPPRRRSNRRWPSAALTARFSTAPPPNAPTWWSSERRVTACSSTSSRARTPSM
jgi:nucleotide-binding universal stress UspA family protein